MCEHTPPCPSADADRAKEAVVISDHSADQGWRLLCNGIIVFDEDSEDPCPVQ